MKNTLLIFIGKLINFISNTLNVGAGSTWPGQIALSANKNFIQDIVQKNPNLKIILIAGTNGKTTTGKMIAAILDSQNKDFFQNATGANLLNGIASSFIQNADTFEKIEKDLAIFEIDENNLPPMITQVRPYAIILLNLFRDQLDRYGELDTIAKKWKNALSSIPNTLNPIPYIIINADDPLLAYIGEELETKNPHFAKTILYFGLPEAQMSIKKPSHGADSIYCPKCGNKLTYSKIAYSHLGKWFCENCKLERPKNIIKNSITSPLAGLYNNYNTQAASTFGKILGLSDKQINLTLKSLTPAFGRQEIIEIEGKKIQIFLSKNPTSFNQSIQTIKDIESKIMTQELRSRDKPTILLVLNDRIPDGTDVSWIWDTNLEQFLNKIGHIIISGDRCYDMGLRVQYAQGKSNIKYQISNNFQNLNEQNTKFIIKEGLKEAIEEGLKIINKNETLYILPTYSAMLEVRKILTGKKIL